MFSNQMNRPMRLTPQRALILKLLKNSTNHPSAENIYDMAKKEFPAISFKTVYNTLSLFARQKTIRELVIDPTKKRYCPVKAPHHHITCTECNKVVDVFVDLSVNLPKKQAAGFNIGGSYIFFYGVCSACIKAATARGQKANAD